MTILKRDDAAGVATLTLNVPEKLNPLSDEMLAALRDALSSIAESDIKCVVLAAEGKAFCAGHNLKEMQGKDPAELKDLFDRCAEVMLLIQSIPQPVIAQVQGMATAAGCQLVATCDMAIASDAAKFGVNGVNIGLFCSTPMVALTRNVTRKAAFEMLTTGRFIEAEEAERLGLINRSVPADALQAEVRQLAETIASKRKAAVKLGKAAFYEQAQMSTANAYAFTGDVMVQNMAQPDTIEGISAFLEKRKPDWD